jgi:flagellar biosynthesis protein FlhB
MAGEKTEKPTPKKLKEARREGRVAKSADVGAWAGMLAASMLLPMVAQHLMTDATDLLSRLRGIIVEPDLAAAMALLRLGGRDAAVIVAPLAGTLLLVGIAASAAQGGLHMATKLLKPKMSRLNPVPGLKRAFGPHAAWEAVKAMLKTAVIGLVLYASVRKLTPLLLSSGALPLAAVLAAVRDAALTLFRSAAVAGLALAAVDYAVIRRKTGKQLRMSKQDIADEHKSSEGNPNLRSAIRSRQLALSRNRMMADLVKADVVVVNPTHVAVALSYDPVRGAPRVVAKGAGAIADKIREVATEHRIPLVQDISLARALHKSCDLGQEIPADLYTAVARVLAFVLTLRARGSAAGLHRTPVQRAS